MTEPDTLSDLLNPVIAAMQRGHYLLYYQRIEALAADGAEPRPFQEILVRFLEEEARLLAPGSFFPMLAEQGLMSLLDCWVVRQVLKLQQIGIDSSPIWVPPRNSINLSQDSIVDPEFVKFVLGQIEKFNPSAETLCFEALEEVVLAQPDALLEMAAALAPRGCNFALGCFTGSVDGFDLLDRLPINFVKIDGGLVQKIANGPRERERVETIHQRCQDLGMRTVAELVETEAVLDVLVEIGIDYAQGFGISQPVPFLFTDLRS